MITDKRVLLIRSDVRLAGPGILMFGVASALRDRGWRVEVAVGSDALTERFTAAGFPVHVVPGVDLGDRTAIRMAQGVAAVRQIVKKGGFTVLHSFNAQAGLIGWLARAGLRAKVVNTVLGAGREGLLKCMPFKLIAVSDFVKRDLVKHGVPENRITTVYNGVLAPEQVLAGKDSFDALWQARQADDTFRIVGIAMMNGDKGQRASIDAFARLAELDPSRKLELVLVGDGARRPSLEEHACNIGVSDRVRFAGALSDVFPELDRAHAFLHLSPQETFGIVLAEAHARGLPTVSYAIGGIPEVVSNQESGILVPLDDTDGVITALHRLAQDRAACETMGWHGLERTRRMFMREALGERIESVYATL